MVEPFYRVWLSVVTLRAQSLGTSNPVGMNPKEPSLRSGEALEGLFLTGLLAEKGGDGSLSVLGVDKPSGAQVTTKQESAHTGCTYSITDGAFTQCQGEKGSLDRHLEPNVAGTNVKPKSTIRVLCKSTARTTHVSTLAYGIREWQWGPEGNGAKSIKEEKN